MNTTDFERECGYMETVKRRNPWFKEGQTVKLTTEQVDTLLRHAFRAGVKSKAASLSIFDGFRLTTKSCWRTSRRPRRPWPKPKRRTPRSTPSARRSPTFSQSRSPERYEIDEL